MALSTQSTAHMPEDLTRDGAVVKTILVEGTGETVGRRGKVGLRYSLRLSEEDDAEPFDSSAKRRDGLLQFTLGRAKVIPALEVVAQSMKVGEKCKASSAAPYAFGTRGLKRKGVPPNAVIFMEVEMVRCEGGEKKKPLAEMSPKEKFEQAKNCKEVGNNLFKEQKYEKALEQYGQSIRLLSDVFYRPSSMLSDSVATPVGQKSSETEQTDPDENRDTEGEEGFQEAEVGEETNDSEPSKDLGEADDTIAAQQAGAPKEETTSSPNGLATDQKDQPSPEAPGDTVPKDEGVVETIDATSAPVPVQESKQAADEQESQSAVTSKAEENVEGKSEPPSDSQGTAEEGDVIGSDDPDEEEVRSLHVTTLNNLSLCYVKLEEYKRAVDSATVALKIDPESSKALYYRGRAKIALGEWEDARVDLEAACKIQPKNPGIRNEIIKLDRKVKSFEDLEKKRAAAMFA